MFDTRRHNCSSNNASRTDISAKDTIKITFHIFRECDDSDKIKRHNNNDTSFFFICFSSSPTTRFDESGDLGHVIPVAAGEQPRVVEGRGVAGLRGRAADRQRDGAATRDRAQEAQATRAVLQSADVRAGATFPPAALPERARARASRVHHPSHADPSEDLVPES